jgi:uncharacterized protein (DUF1499 family)
MGRIVIVLWVVLALAVVAMGYVRLAPSAPAQWHLIPPFEHSADFEGGAVRVVRTGPDALEQLNAVALATPRTTVLAGWVAAGMVTYVTRSAVFGFPDYTTARQDGDVLVVWARSRFGRSDLGVNRDRIDRWLEAIQPR